MKRGYLKLKRSPQPKEPFDDEALASGKQRLGYLALYIGIWTLPGLMAAGQVYSEAWFECKPIAWSQAVIWQMPTWYLWADKGNQSTARANGRQIRRTGLLHPTIRY